MKKPQTLKSLTIHLLIAVFVMVIVSSCASSKNGYGNKCMSSKFIGYSVR